MIKMETLKLKLIKKNENIHRFAILRERGREGQKKRTQKDEKKGDRKSTPCIVASHKNHGFLEICYVNLKINRRFRVIYILSPLVRKMYRR